MDFLSDSDFDFFRFEKATSLLAAVSFAASSLSASEFKAFFFGTAPCWTVPASFLTEPASLIIFNLAVIFFSGDAELYFRTCSRITGVKARIADSYCSSSSRILFSRVLVATLWISSSSVSELEYDRRLSLDVAGHLSVSKSHNVSSDMRDPGGESIFLESFGGVTVLLIS